MQSASTFHSKFISDTNLTLLPPMAKISRFHGHLFLCDVSVRGFECAYWIVFCLPLERPISQSRCLLFHASAVWLMLSLSHWSWEDWIKSLRMSYMPMMVFVRGVVQVWEYNRRIWVRRGASMVNILHLFVHRSVLEVLRVRWAPCINLSLRFKLLQNFWETWAELRDSLTRFFER